MQQQDDAARREAALRAAHSAGERMARQHLHEMQMITDGYRIIENVCSSGFAPLALNAFWLSYISYLIGHMHAALGADATRAVLHQVMDEWERDHAH